MLIKPGGPGEASEVRPKSAGWRGMGKHMEKVLVVFAFKAWVWGQFAPTLPFIFLTPGSWKPLGVHPECGVANSKICHCLIHHHQWGGGGNPSRRALKLDLGSRVLQMLLLFSLSFFIFYYSILFFGTCGHMCHTVCGILAPQRQIQPATPALGVWGLNPWMKLKAPSCMADRNIDWRRYSGEYLGRKWSNKIYIYPKIQEFSSLAFLKGIHTQAHNRTRT